MNNKLGSGIRRIFAIFDCPSESMFQVLLTIFQIRRLSLVNTDALQDVGKLSKDSNSILDPSCELLFVLQERFVNFRQFDCLGFDRE